MKKITILIGLIISFFLTCCTDPAKPIPITFVFEEALTDEKYPDYFKEITTPFSATNCDEDYLLKPISVTRLDIKRAPVEINAWYFEQMGDNTVEFSKNWLSQYYKDSLVNKHLKLPAKRAVNTNSLDKYLNKESALTLIFSEESDNDIYKEHKIFVSAKEITKHIRTNICNTKYNEVVVLVNPSKLKSKGTIFKENVVKSEEFANPCNEISTSKAIDLNNDIKKIISNNKTMVERLNFAEKVWDKYCHPNAYVALYKNKNKQSVDVWDPGSGKNYFTNRLAVLESILSTAIFRVEMSKDGKITGIHIIECQNVNELL